MKISALQAGFKLDHIALETTKKKRLANFYKKIMGMDYFVNKDGDMVCIGPLRKLIIKDGINNKLSFAGFSCRSENDLKLFKSYVTSNKVKILDFINPYFKERAFSISDPDGNIISFGVGLNETQKFNGILNGPLQHLTFSSSNVERFQKFYSEKLGFKITDIVIHDNGTLATSFVTSNHEHHTLACFKANKVGIDHHSYEVGEWNFIRDWCDHFSKYDIKLRWGPGRHGPGNNLFVFIKDVDNNWIELSAELETVHDREIKKWPQAEKTLNLWGKGILRS